MCNYCILCVVRIVCCNTVLRAATALDIFQEIWRANEGGSASPEEDLASMEVGE